MVPCQNFSAVPVEQRKGVFTLMMTSAFFDVDSNFFNDIKEWSEPFFDTHQLGIKV